MTALERHIRALARAAAQIGEPSVTVRIAGRILTIPAQSEKRS